MCNDKLKNPQANKSLCKLDILKKKQLDLGLKIMKAYNGAVYPVDLMAISAINRSLSLIRGFTDLIKKRNLACAAPILRLQLDTALRFSAATLVKDPHAFAKNIFAGEQINHIKDLKGKRLSDKYLVEQLSKKYPWIEKVYKETCAFVHFSDKHFLHPMTDLNNNGRTINFHVSEYEKVSIEHYLEAINAFIAVTNILNEYLKGWLIIKDNPELVDQLRKEIKSKKP